MFEGRGLALYRVVRQVRPLVLDSVRVLEVTLAPFGLTVGMRAVLEVLAELGPATAPAIGERLDLARQGVQRHVNDLVGLGYVEVRANPAHRRSVLIALTDAGAALFDRLRDEELRRLAPMAGECSPDEIAAAIKVLTALNRDVRQQAARPPAPDKTAQGSGDEGGRDEGGREQGGGEGGGGEGGGDEGGREQGGGDEG
ncbi:MAG TPA: MarR family winged helix-turn-helix transcriptional regulator, partial [Actinoplanes sp.]